MGLFSILSKNKSESKNNNSVNKNNTNVGSVDEFKTPPIHRDLALTDVMFNTNDYAAKNILSEDNKETLNILDTDFIVDCKYKYMDNVVTMNILNYISSIGRESFRNCDSLRSFTIIPPIDNLSIDDFAFCDDKNLIHFNCENSTFSKIGKNAFSNCNSLQKIVLKGLSKIEENTFLLNTSLTDVDIENVVSIKNGAFQQCNSLQNIEFSKSLKNIDSFAFCNCDLLTLTFPHTLKFIGGFAFEDNFNLTDIYFEHTNEDIIELGSNIFNHCKNVIIHTDNDYIYEYCQENDYTVVR
jgi:hypothetical protein